MPGSGDKAGPSQRQLRVGELLRKVLSEVFIRAEIRDPDLESVILSVSEVSVSPDMRNATAFVMPLGEVDEVQVLSALQRNKKFVRGIIARQVDLKYMPELSFKLDETLGRAERIDALLRSPKVAQDLE